MQRYFRIWRRYNTQSRSKLKDLKTHLSHIFFAGCIFPLSFFHSSNFQGLWAVAHSMQPSLCVCLTWLCICFLLLSSSLFLLDVCNLLLLSVPVDSSHPVAPPTSMGTAVPRQAQSSHPRSLKGIQNLITRNS